MRPAPLSARSSPAGLNHLVFSNGPWLTGGSNGAVFPPGGSATFNVTAVGNGGGLTYSWLFNFTPNPGATNPSYTVSNVSSANVGTYSSASVIPALIRGVGPALPSFGVAGALDDPKLTVYGGHLLIDANDNWDASRTLVTAQAAVGAFALAPGSRDAALIRSDVPAGSYSIQITGAGGAAGVALADFGITGTLADPRLVVFSGQTVIASNDNWDAAVTPLATPGRAGGFGLPVGSRDAALIVNLAPGPYSAKVSGAGATAGVALVEIYELP